MPFASCSSATTAWRQHDACIKQHTWPAQALALLNMYNLLFFLPEIIADSPPHLSLENESVAFMVVQHSP